MRTIGKLGTMKTRETQKQGNKENGKLGNKQTKNLPNKINGM